MTTIKILRVSAAALLLCASMSEAALAAGTTCARAADGTDLTSYVTLTQSQMSGITGNTACMATNGAAYNGVWENQEYLSGGTIVEHSSGASLGRYGASGTTLNFVYNSGATYDYYVYAAASGTIAAGNTYYFCLQGGSGVAYKIALEAGKVACS